MKKSLKNVLSVFAVLTSIGLMSSFEANAWVSADLATVGLGAANDAFSNTNTVSTRIKGVVDEIPSFEYEGSGNSDFVGKGVMAEDYTARLMRAVDSVTEVESKLAKKAPNKVDKRTMDQVKNYWLANPDASSTYRKKIGDRTEGLMVDRQDYYYFADFLGNDAMDEIARLNSVGALTGTAGISPIDMFVKSQRVKTPDFDQESARENNAARIMIEDAQELARVFNTKDAKKARKKLLRIVEDRGKWASFEALEGSRGDVIRAQLLEWSRLSAKEFNKRYKTEIRLSLRESAEELFDPADKELVKSVQSGNVVATFNLFQLLAPLVDKNDAEAGTILVAVLKSLSQQKFSPAVSMLGQVYRFGWWGEDRNENLASMYWAMLPNDKNALESRHQVRGKFVEGKSDLYRAAGLGNAHALKDQRTTLRNERVLKWLKILGSASLVGLTAAELVVGAALPIPLPPLPIP
ncbi:MAG: hypothetical protein HOK20_03065 [Alphaproteobacteria bacterium]|nr:hypothetical protein [Alphaproteobacteria bacterium]